MEFNVRELKYCIAGVKEKYMKMITENLKSHNPETDILYPDIRSYFKK